MSGEVECPKCGQPGLEFDDDIDAEGPGTGEWYCPHCGYRATEHEYETDLYFEDEYEGFEDESDDSAR
jgi:uncharacterized Zn finger protein (UPF0148 family)